MINLKKITLISFSAIISVSSVLFFINISNIIFSPKYSQKQLEKNLAEANLENYELNFYEINKMKSYEAISYKEALSFYETLNYDFNLQNKNENIEIPIIQPKNVPVDIKYINNIKDRKDFFIKMVLPMAVKMNSETIRLRKKIISIYDNYSAGGTLSGNDFELIKFLSLVYNVQTMNKNLKKIKNELLEKINIIPNSIIISQLAINSLWGQNSKLVDKNILYEKNNGVEKIAIEGLTPYKSLQNYYFYINSNERYSNFRKKRQNLLEEKMFLKGNEISAFLKPLSGKSKNYTSDIKVTISANYLENLDHIIGK